MTFTIARLAPSRCPNCGEPLDAATSPDPDARPPAPGDVSVCIACSTILVFDHGLKLALPSPAQLDQLLAEDPALLDYVQAATEARRDEPEAGP